MTIEIYRLAKAMWDWYPEHKAGNTMEQVSWSKNQIIANTNVASSGKTGAEFPRPGWPVDDVRYKC